jgi:integrase
MTAWCHPGSFLVKSGLGRVPPRGDQGNEARQHAAQTPAALGRTFASLLFAIGVPPTRAMKQMGHTSASLTLEVYARDMERRRARSATGSC